MSTTADAVSTTTSSSSAQGSAEFERFAEFLREAQERMCREAAEADGKATFCTDQWSRVAPSEGFGVTRVLEGGRLLEKAAVSTSVIHGRLTPERAAAMSSRGRADIDPAGGQPYSAAALSLVFHAASPMVPTFRADVRFFEVNGRGWYGGGADLTPYYLEDDEEGYVQVFHRQYKAVCDAHAGPGAYQRFKKWCDDYFYIPCRGEHRGVGGIFFDDLDAFSAADWSAAAEDGAAAPPPSGASGAPSAAAAGSPDKTAYDFVTAVAREFLPSYLPLATRRNRLPFTAAQRQWQLERRGRYLEFNLLYDRGVRFGLTGGRIESVMVSAPPLIAWAYNRQPEPGSEEARLVDVLRQPREWI